MAKVTFYRIRFPAKHVIIFFLYLHNSSEFCRLSYDDEILTSFVSDLKICFLANLLSSFHTYLRIRRVTWLRAATAMFMHAHFNRWHYYILQFFLRLSLYCFSYCSSPNNWSSANISSLTHVWRVACRKAIVIYLQTGPKFPTYIEGQKAFMNTLQ